MVCSAVLALVEGDRGGGAEGLALPLVAGARSQSDLDRVAPALASGEAAEVDARGKRGDRHRALVAGDGHRELREIRRRQALRKHDVADRVAQRHVGGDAARVLDDDRLRLRLTRLQVDEVEVERPLRTDAIAQADREGRRGDVDVTGVGGREVRSRHRREQQCCGNAEGGDTGAGTDEGLLGNGLEGHGCPLSVTFVTS